MIRKIRVDLHSKQEEFDTEKEAFKFARKHFKNCKYLQMRVICYKEQKDEKW